MNIMCCEQKNSLKISLNIIIESEFY
jgi:hypothetical protein